MPTPTSTAARYGMKPDLTSNRFGLNLWDLPHLLPTPCATGEGAQRNLVDRRRKKQQMQVGDVLREIEMVDLLPTPTTVDSKVFGPNIDWQLRLANHAPHTASVLMQQEAHQGFGKYESAVDRWTALTRPAPPPIDGRGLLPAFVEWMMGLPEGWVCDLGLSRTAELKMLGNGVVPAQAGLALELLDPNE